MEDSKVIKHILRNKPMTESENCFAFSWYSLTIVDSNNSNNVGKEVGLTRTEYISNVRFVTQSLINFCPAVDWERFIAETSVLVCLIFEFSFPFWWVNKNKVLNAYLAQLVVTRNVYGSFLSS